MPGTIRQLWIIVDTRDGLRLVGLVLLMIVGSLLEALGIGLILPFLQAASDPTGFIARQETGMVMRRLGIVDANKIVLAGAVLLAVVFIVKNIYLIIQWKLVYAFLYSRIALLGKTLLSGYLHSPYEFHFHRSSADLIRNTTSEVELVFGAVVRSVLIIVAEFFVIAGLLTILFLAQPVVAAIAVGFIAVLAWGLLGRLRRRLRDLGHQRIEQRSRMIRSVSHGFSGLKEIKVLGREEYFTDHYMNAATGVAEAEEKSSILQQYPRAVLETGAVVGLIGLVLVLLERGDLTAATPVLALFGVAMIRLMPSANRIVNSINAIRYNTGAVEVVYRELVRIRAQRLETPDERNDAPVIRLRGQLDICDVRYTYPGSRQPALERIRLTIECGESVGITGASGSGKTTLVNLVLGLLEPDEGHIYVDGSPISECRRAWQNRIGYIPQDIYLLDDTIRRNVSFGLPDERISDDRIWEVLEAVQIRDFVRNLEEGLDTEVGERGLRISGGQRQRIGIARALYHDPDVLVLDEATASLDFETEERVTEAIEALAGEKTLIIVTHRLRTIRACDSIYLLEDGRLSAKGTYRELLQTNPSFRRMAQVVGLS